MLFLCGICGIISYRKDNHKKVAVGTAIPNGLYNSTLQEQNSSVKVLSRNRPLPLARGVYFFLFSVISAIITLISVSVNTAKLNAKFAASYDTIVSPPLYWG